MKKPKLLLADDHPLILEGIRRVLEPEFEVAGVASNGRDLLRQAAVMKPDAVLLDIGMPELNGVETARQIKSTLPDTRIVFVTQMEDREYVRGAFRAGASAYLLKQEVAAELVPALRSALDGKVYVSPSLQGNGSGTPFDTDASGGEVVAETLTPRQREVLQLIAEGNTAKEIAGTLGVSARTVEFHKAGLMETLRLRTMAELTRYALDQKIA